MRGRLPARIVLAVLVLAAGRGAPARGEDVAGPRLGRVLLLEDPGRKESVGSVSRIAREEPGRLRPVSDVLVAGYTRSASWLVFDVDAPAGEAWLSVLPSYLDDVRLYEPSPGTPGGWQERRAGDSMPWASREVPYRGFVFRLRFAERERRPLLIRLETTSSSALALDVSPPDAFRAAAAADSALYLVGLGFLLTVLLDKTVSWFWIRDPLTPWFLAYLACMTGTFLTNGGYVAQFFVPSQPLASDAATKVISILTIAAGNGLYRRVFHVTREQRFLWGLYAVGAWAPLAGVLLVPFGLFTEVMRLLVLLVLGLTALGIVLSFRLWRSGSPGGTMLLVANVFAMGGLLGFASSHIGLLPARASLLYALPVSSLGSVFALHLGLAARFGALREARNRAEEDARQERELRRKQGRFIDLVTHEYRTPLAILRTNLDILHLSRDDGQRGKSLEAMGIAVRRLGDIFTGSQREGDWGGARQIAPEAVDLRGLLERVVAEARASEVASGRPVVLSAGESPRVEADAGLLAAVLRNLLDNALKYGAPGSRIEVRLAAGERGAEVVVANDCARAPGLPPADLVRRGSRGENAAGIPGTGMGLHLVRKLVDDIGGDVEISVPGGRRFEAKIVLPRRRRFPSLSGLPVDGSDGSDGRGRGSAGGHGASGTGSPGVKVPA